MHALARLAHDLMSRVRFLEKPLPDPEPVTDSARPVVGFFAGLSASQKAKALAYRGPESHGDPELKTHCKA